MSKLVVSERPTARTELEKRVNYMRVVASTPELLDENEKQITSFLKRAEEFKRRGEGEWEARFDKRQMDYVQERCGRESLNLEQAIAFHGFNVDDSVKLEVRRLVAMQSVSTSYGYSAFSNYRALFVQKLIELGVADKNLMLLGLEAIEIWESRRLDVKKEELALSKKYNLSRAASLESRISEDNAKLAELKERMDALKAAKSDEEILRIAFAGIPEVRLLPIIQSFSRVTADNAKMLEVVREQSHGAVVNAYDMIDAAAKAWMDKDAAKEALIRLVRSGAVD